MSAIDSAIARLQDLAQACTTVVFKSAPDYPVENVEPFPCSIAYIVNGTFRLTNRTIHRNFPVIAVEMHFSRVNLKQAYQQINAIAIEFPRRLAADPTLNGTVDTIIATQDQPITYEVRPFTWGVQREGAPVVTSQMLSFNIPIKTLQAPLSA
jgi:hypothetical protein